MVFHGRWYPLQPESLRNLGVVPAFLLAVGMISSAPAAAVPVKVVADNSSSDPAIGDGFGYAVAASGNTVVVGVPDADGKGTSAGAVYVFVKNAATWVKQAKIEASDGKDGDGFGYSVAIDGDILIVGAPFSDPSGKSASGSAYVYLRNKNNGTWSQEGSRLAPLELVPGDLFGFSVGVAGPTVSQNGHTAVVGAPLRDDKGQDAGAAYAFVRTVPTVGSPTWSAGTRITANDGDDVDHFGHAVAAHEDTLVVGAPLADLSAGTDAGAAYVYTRGNSLSWDQRKKLTASDASAADQFGFSVAFKGQTVLVGAPLDDVNGAEVSGSAYAFFGAAATWVQQAKLQASNGKAGDEFGYSVALDSFGVGLDKDLALIGARRQDYVPAPNDNREDAGGSYLFQRNGTSWLQRCSLPSDRNAGDQFGFAEGLSGITGIVGAPTDDDLGADSGTATIYDLVDVDGDGVPDVCDNCPAAQNAEQADFDGDGVGDVCDNCKCLANPDQDDSDNDKAGDECDILPSTNANGVCLNPDRSTGSVLRPQRDVVCSQLIGPQTCF